MVPEIFTSAIPTIVACLLLGIVGMLVLFCIPEKYFLFGLTFCTFPPLIIFLISIYTDLTFFKNSSFPSSRLLMLTPRDWIFALLITIVVMIFAVSVVKVHVNGKIPTNIEWITFPTLLALTTALVMTLAGSNLPTHENTYLVREKVYSIEKDRQTGGTNFILRDENKNLYLLRTDVVTDTQSIEYNLGAEPYLGLVCTNDKDPIHRIKDVMNLEKEIYKVQVCKSDPLVTENKLDKIVAHDTRVNRGTSKWALAIF